MSDQSSRPGKPLVVVSVGTDHHPFNRLVGWMDDWAEQHSSVMVCIQYGASHPPRTAAGHAILPHSELLGLFGRATCVVLQGGPGGVMDARRMGALPIVVPRDPALGEILDQHQQDFSLHLASRSVAKVATTEAELRSLLDHALTHPELWRIDTDATVPEGVSTIMERLAEAPPRSSQGFWTRVRIAARRKPKR